MTEDPRLAGQVGRKAARKIDARRRGARSVWSGFGLFGLVGWSVALPALLGALLGGWLDARAPGGRSWTLALLLAGLTLGCLNAWQWISREDRAMHADEPPPDSGDDRDD